MSISVLGIGDNVVDKYLHSGIMYPGGNALNFFCLCEISRYPQRVYGGRLAMTRQRGMYRMYYTSYR